MPALAHSVSLKSIAAVLGGGRFSPLALFAASEPGGWYDPSDFDRYMSVLGSELVTNGTFDSNVTGWTVNTLQGENTTITRDTSIFTAGGMKVSAPIYPAVGQVLSGLTVGRSYKVSCQMYSDSLRTSLSIGTASNNQVGWVGVSAVNQTQTLSFVFVAPATSMTVWASKSLFNVGWASGDFYIDNISVRELTAIDTATLFQDAAGTTPVTAVEQPVGLVLDKSRGLAGLGAQTLTNGDFSSGTASWTAIRGSISSSSGQLTVTGAAGTYPGVWQSFSTVAGRTYSASFEIVSTNVGAVRLVIRDGTDPSSGTILSDVTYGTTGAKALSFVASSANTVFYVIGETALAITFVIDNASVKTLGPGSHLSQSTSTARPVLSARVSLLTRTEDVSNAAWGKANCTATATTITATATSGVILSQLVTTTLVTSWTYSAKVLKGTSFVIGLAGGLSGSAVIFNGTTGAYVGASGTGTKWSISSYSCVTHPSDSGYWLVTVTGANSSSDENSVYPVLAINTTGGTTWASGWGASVGSTLTATQHDLRVANAGVGLPAYQRVTTSTDYDTTGFPLYLKFDGTDDSLSSASIDFTSTDKMSVFAGVRQTSAASTSPQIIAELSAIANSNAGSFLFDLQDGATTEDAFYSRGSGSLAGARWTSAPTTPATAIYTAQANISAPSVSLRVNGSQVASATTSQGTGNYGNYPLYIGRRNNTDFPLGGWIYSLIVRGAASTDAQIASTETWVNNRTKAY